ncbi:MAG: putative membrane protein [Roseivirga sp.]|jgi:putative membrane protein
MNNLLIKLIVNTLSVFITAWILGDAVQLDGFGTAILVAIVLALLNVTIKPLLIFFTIPATVFSLGLFLFVINAVVILLADNLIAGFAVRGFWWALLFSLVMSFVNSVLNGKGGVRREPPR